MGKTLRPTPTNAYFFISLRTNCYRINQFSAKNGKNAPKFCACIWTCVRTVLNQFYRERVLQSHRATGAAFWERLAHRG